MKSDAEGVRGVIAHHRERVVGGVLGQVLRLDGPLPVCVPVCGGAGTAWSQY
jgi:hypothetical protein